MKSSSLQKYLKSLLDELSSPAESMSVTPALAALLELNATSTAECEFLRSRLVSSTAGREDELRQRTRLEARCVELEGRLQQAHESSEKAKAALTEQERHLEARKRDFEDEVGSLRAEVERLRGRSESHDALADALQESYKQCALAKMAQIAAEQAAEDLRSLLAIRTEARAAEVQHTPPPPSPSPALRGASDRPPPLAARGLRLDAAVDSAMAPLLPMLPMLWDRVPAEMQRRILELSAMPPP